MIRRRNLAALLFCAVTATALASDSPAAPWASLASKDVAGFCSDIRGVHPGMVDPLAPMFSKQVERACETAANASRPAASFLDWREIMQALVTSFRDGHTGIRFTVEPTQLRWPGFLMDGQGG